MVKIQDKSTLGRASPPPPPKFLVKTTSYIHILEFEV